MNGFRGLLVLLVVLCVVYAGYKVVVGDKEMIKISDEKPIDELSTLMVECDPGVLILLEGKAAGTYNADKLCWEVVDLKPGQYRLEAVLEKHEDQSCWVALLPGATLSLTLDPFVPLNKTTVKKVTKPIAKKKAVVASAVEEEPVDENTRILDLGGEVTMELVWCPPGRFMMGPGEGMATPQPAHEVVLTQGFWMGKYEVTQAQYLALMDMAPSNFKKDANPVEKVNWQAAVTFCETVSRIANVKCRLPTEAQWEYACRAGVSPDVGLDAVGWYNLNSKKSTHPVGMKEPNAWGLFDMQGNVAEWCADWMGDYSAESTTDPTGLEKGSNKVQRGGGWNSNANYCSPTFRYGSSPICSNYYLGFRVMVAADDETIKAVE